MKHDDAAVVTRILGREPGSELVSGLDSAKNAGLGALVTKWLPATARTRESAAGAAPDDSRGGSAEAETVLVVASLEQEDRAGDIVLASGWELGSFEANPVILWAHDYGRPAIGKAIRVWVEGSALMAQIQFASTPFAREVRALYLEGFMRGISVGFRAIETERRESSTGGTGILFKRQELLEISAAPVPLNPAALARPGGRKNELPRSELEEEARDPQDQSGRQASLTDVRDLWSEAAGVVA